MRFKRLYLFAATLMRFFGQGQGLNPLEIKGYKFFDSVTGEEVVIKGVDYYPRPNRGDLNHNSVDYYTANFTNIWSRDIPYFQELGINAIRLYAVDGQQNHDDFMCALEEAGIYVIVALAHDCPTCAVTRDNAKPNGKCYPPELKAQGQEIISEFSKYSNTLAFSSGNEVNHFAPIRQPEWNAPCQKKFIRDMREFVHSCSDSMRPIPIGLVAADAERTENIMYYNCQEDPEDPYQNAEWYGLNTYVNCDGKAATYEEALGLRSLELSFDSYNMSIPVLLTEFGCLSETFPSVDGYESQRDFLQAKWMLEEPALRDLFAGGFAFEYSMEAANAEAASPYPFKQFGKQAYGIGYFSPRECNDVDTPCEYNPMPSYYFLQEAFNTSISNVTTLDSFHVSPWREGRSTCPERYPKLSSIQWEADKHDFMQCPSKKKLPSFTCKNRNREDIKLRTGFEYADTALSSNMLLVLLLGILAAIALIRYLCRNRNRSEYEELQESGSQSSGESKGLFMGDSEAGYRDSKAPYQAIDSDSSSDGKP